MPTPVSLPSLSEPRRRTLAAAVGRILPSDDGPGAEETGVAAYIEGALREAAWRPHLPLIEQGLDLLDSLALDRHDASFAACPPEAQDRVLRHLEGLGEPWPHAFLHRLVLLALEGFLCDPARGGNHGGLGWRYIGYPPEAPGPDPGRGERP